MMATTTSSLTMQMTQSSSTNTATENVTDVVFNYTRADLEELNDRRARTLIPAMVVLAVLMLIGIVGNTLVCYVFCYKLRSGTQNFLIVCLAVFDLLSCTIAIPNEIADMRFYYIFESAAACKIMRFINTFSAIGSILTLVVIAIDRYRKICKPFGNQLHMVHVRLSLIPILGGALFFGWPAFIMYGLRTTETVVPGIIGQDCSTPDGIGETIYPLIYNLVLFLCFIILAVTLVILYTFVLKETKRHNRYLKRNSDYGLHSNSHYSEDSRCSIDLSPGPYTLSYSHKHPEPTAHANEAFDFSSNPDAVTTSSLPHLGDESTRPEVMSNGTHDASVSKLAIAGSSLGHETNLTEIESNSKRPLTSKDSDTMSSPHTANGTSVRKPSIAGSSLSQRTNITDIESNSKRPLTSKDSDTPSSLHTANGILNSTKRSSVSFPDENHHHHHENGEKHVHIAILNSDDSAKSHQGSGKVRRRHFIKSKTTIIAFLVTLVFILSFLPHLSLQVAKLIDKGFDYELEDGPLVAYNLFLRSYFINSVSNPIIYGALNVQFSGEVRGLLKRLCQKT